MPARARIAVLYNVPTLDPGHPEAGGGAATASAVVAALKAARMKPFRLGVATPVTRFVRRLDRQKPDAVFHLAEGFGGAAEGKAWVASMLEMMGLPYTGCPPLVIELCRLEETASRLLRGSGLPVADTLVEDSPPGPEFHVGVIDLDGPAALPVAEIPDDLAATLSDLAVRAFRATGCRDFARVGFRLDGDGRPMIVAVDPNPDLGPRDGWARALEASGRGWDQTIVDLTRKALRRRS